MKPFSPPIIVLSGPSGCGKSSLLQIIFKQLDAYYFSISTTTREPRVHEKHGREYFFVSQEEFEASIAKGEFLEYAKVHNNYYGTSLVPIQEALEQNKIVLFDIDVQGHAIVKQKLARMVTSIFITTPSLNELQKRLESRKTDDEKTITRRIENAKNEINAFDTYDFLVMNDDLQKAAQQVLTIIQNASTKTSLYDKETLVKNWLLHG